MRPRKCVTVLKALYYLTLLWVFLYCVHHLTNREPGKTEQSQIRSIVEGGGYMQKNNNDKKYHDTVFDAGNNEKYNDKKFEIDTRFRQERQKYPEDDDVDDDDDVDAMKEAFQGELKGDEGERVKDKNKLQELVVTEPHQNHGIAENRNHERDSTACERKTRIVYIKTHKTGSCTTTNMLYRFALKYDVPTLLFTFFPYPAAGINRYYIHTHTFLEEKGKPLTKRFQLAADHMRYEREEFDKVMEGDVLYTTTLRNPPDHLRSVFSYFDVAKKLGISSNITDPVEEYILNKDKYPKTPTLMENRNADMLGFDTKNSNDSGKIQEFIKKMDSELGFVMVTEYSAESYIVLRRKMCWDISDILYISINLRKYKNQGSSLSEKALKLHKQWNNVDYMLYDHFNKTLWKQIDLYGQDFLEELTLYRKYLDDIKNYCDPLVNQVQRNQSILRTLQDILNKVPPLTFSETKYGKEFGIDVVWCTLSQINIMEFYNIMRVKQFPALCDFLHTNASQVAPNDFKLFDGRKVVSLFSRYCAENEHGTLAPLKSIAGCFLWWARKFRKF